MKSNPIRLLSVAAFIVVLAALLTKCTKEVGTLPKLPTGCDTVTYQKQIKKLADENCVRCHNETLTNAGYDFSKYEGLKAASDDGQLYYAIFTATPPDKMPQDSVDVLTATEKSMIECWINNGEKK
jgi:hypothetical protein